MAAPRNGCVGKVYRVVLGTARRHTLRYLELVKTGQSGGSWLDVSFSLAHGARKREFRMLSRFSTQPVRTECLWVLIQHQLHDLDVQYSISEPLPDAHAFPMRHADSWYNTRPFLHIWYRWVTVRQVHRINREGNMEVDCCPRIE